MKRTYKYSKAMKFLGKVLKETEKLPDRDRMFIRNIISYGIMVRLALLLMEQQDESNK